jgi:hypothetical protein
MISILDIGKSPEVETLSHNSPYRRYQRSNNTLWTLGARSKSTYGESTGIIPWFGRTGLHGVYAYLETGLWKSS